MNDTDILDWMEKHLDRVYGNETSVSAIEWWQEYSDVITRTEGQSLRDCVIKANKDK